MVSRLAGRWSDRLSGDAPDAPPGGFVDPTGSVAAEQRSRRANRRRLVVFLSVFAAVTLVGMIWDFSRPAVYESSARLNFVPADGTPPVEPTPTPDDVAANGKRYALRDEVQYLTSTTLLAKVADDLKTAQGTPATLRTGDPAATLQAMLTARQVPGTNIVAIDARGGDPDFLPVFVDRLIADYQATLDARYQGGSTTALDDTRDEVRKLTSGVADKRREVDAFRAKNNIVSLERDENQVLSEVKGTGTALNTANEKVAAAEAKLNALRDAQVAGKSVTRAKDNPTLAALEQQAVGLRADLRATARQFTQEYMNIDPRIRAEKAQLADIEEQIVSVRKDSAQGAVQEAQEEVASARGAVATLRSQLSANQSSVQSFTSHFNEYKNLQDQLTHLETLRQKAVDRLSVLDAGERGRKPKVEIVESASLPQSPASPAYARDAAIVLFAALLAALATMGIVELFNRAPRQASTVVIPQTWAPVGMAHRAPTALPAVGGFEALPDRSDDRNLDLLERGGALPAPLPRELIETELARLLGTADPEFRAILVLLMTGLTSAEIVALRRGDVDRVAGTVAVSGNDARDVVVPSQTLAWAERSLETAGPADAPLFVTAGHRTLTEATIATALLYAAHDAGIEAADEVTPETLRHTYIAFLVRQGVRFLEVARLVGTLPSERLTAYKRMAPAGVVAMPIERILPAVRNATA